MTAHAQAQKSARPPSSASILASIESGYVKSKIPDFKPGDTVKVRAKIIEGQKERIQTFEGVVIRRHNRNRANASFTVRKVSYNIGVERTFPLHSPRIEAIELVSSGIVRRSKLYYLRDIRGKASRIKTKLRTSALDAQVNDQAGNQESAVAATPAE